MFEPDALPLSCVTMCALRATSLRQRAVLNESESSTRESANPGQSEHSPVSAGMGVLSVKRSPTRAGTSSYTVGRSFRIDRNPIPWPARLQADLN